MEQETLWAKVIRSKFGLHNNNWDSRFPLRSSYRSPWKFIYSLYSDFRQLVRFKVGDERRIRFWEDVWWGEEAFAIRFPDLYRLSLAKNQSIANIIVQHTGSITQGWDLHFHRNLHHRELENFAIFSVALDHVRLNVQLSDLRIWKPDSLGGFSCKVAFLS